MSLFSEYKKEREGKYVIESDRGFLVYSVNKDSLYIEDIFVLKEYRHSGLAQQMADWAYNMAKQSHCKRLIGSVAPSANGSTYSMILLIKYGFNLLSSDKDMVYFYKEVK